MSRQASVRLSIPQMWVPAVTLLNRINEWERNECPDGDRRLRRMCCAAYNDLSGRR